ncbi:hypothetical protein ACQ4PT_037010 [Festuca glaucescens]
MGNSCVTGSGQSNHGQSQEPNGAQTTFKWTVDGFSSLLDKGNGWTNSSVFQIRGLNWYLKLNPRDTKIGGVKEYVSLKLVLTQQHVRSGTVVDASFKFLIYDQSYGKHNKEYQGSSLSIHLEKMSGNYLSLYLSMKVSDTLHQSSGNLVELSISIKDQETGKHRKLSGRFQFSKNSPSWGWPKFISLEDFKDSSNGFLVKKKCCIEAQVAAIGSSKIE